MIVYKKTDEWYIEWQRVTTSSTTSDNEWQRRTTNDKEWCKEWQQVVQREATSDNEWQRVTTNDNEWKQMTSDKEWSFWLICFSFWIRDESTTMHPKETL